MSDGKVVIKSGLWYTVSNFLTKGLVFLTTPLFTRLLTQEEFGAFSNFTSWLNILIAVVTLNVEASLISARFDYEDRLDSYVFSALSLSSISVLICAVIANIFMGPISRWMSLDPLYINFMFAYLFFFPAFQLFQTQERFFFRYKNSVLLSVTSSGGACLMALVLVFLMNNRLSGRILGHVAPTILIGLALYFYIAKKGKRIDFGVYKYVLKVCLPYIPHLLSMTVLTSVGKIMITNLCGEKENALFSVAYSVAMIVTLFLTALNGAYSPWLAEKLAQEKYGEVRKTSKYYIALFMFFGLGLMLLAPEVLFIMGGRAYMEAKTVMVPVALGCMCQFLYTMFVNVEQFCKKTVGMAVASLSAAGLNYVLNLLLIPRYGYVAAAYAALLGYLWLLGAHMLLVRLINKQEVYSYRFVFAMVAALALAGALMLVLYQYNGIRYVCIAAYAAVFFWLGYTFRKPILTFFKK